MLSWLPSIPYPPPDQPGYWDPVTSTLQWCEEDYYATYYSAEIINTLTNFMFIYLAYEGVKSCRKHGHDTIFHVAYFGYFLVGIGSFMFHTTLKYPWQLVDELNMIYTTCLMCHASLSHKRPLPTQILIGLAFTSLSLFITAYYHYLQDPVFHQNVYAALTIFIVFRSIYSMETSLRPSLRKSEEKDRLLKVEEEKKGEHTGLVITKERQMYENERDANILANMWKLVGFGITMFLGGFALWGVDNVYCSTMRTWRREIGMPWGFFLELHGWWHLMTGIGAYCYLVWGIHLRHVLNGNHDLYEMKWERIYRLPEIVRKEEKHVNGNGTVNGHVLNGKAKH